MYKVVTAVCFIEENNWEQSHSCQWGMVAQWNFTQLREHLHLCVCGYLFYIRTWTKMW